MDEDPFSGWGLRSVELADKAVLDPYFASLSEPLSDYTFSQLYTWRNSLRILWKQMDGHLCVFANGSGDLTLLLPPIGETSCDRALRGAFELMDDYNAAHGVPERSRVEYASEELLARFNRAGLSLRPMGADYVYDVQRMIDLAGGDLASKRQAKNRFMRNYRFRVEPYSAGLHRGDCLQLLDTWKIHQDAQHLEESDSNAIKRSKESIATALCLESAEVLGLKGMVVYVDEESAGDSGFRGQGSGREPAESGGSDRVREDGISAEMRSSLNLEPRTANPALKAFTFGEPLGSSQSSITIEKTDLAVKGLAQFVFSEFCRVHWGHLPLVNVGDDWGLETLAWTKQSYRPVKMLRKFVFRRERAVVSPAGYVPPEAVEALADAPEPEVIAESASQQESDAAFVAPDVFMSSLFERMEAAAVSRAPVLIRPAERGDLPATHDLEQATFTQHAITRRQMQYLQQRDSAVFLVADRGGRVVGDGIALIRQHKNGRTGRIYSLVVAEQHRGQKIGRKLFKAMLEELSRRGVSRVYLEVEEANAGAVRLYESFGFRRIGVLPDYYGRGNPGAHMMYEATAPHDAAVGTR